MSTMSLTQAKSEALRLAGEGAAYATIAEHLKAKGYVSPKTGQPLSTARVGQLILASGHRRKAKPRKASARRAAPTTAAAEKRPARRAAPTTAVDKLTAVKSILNVASMSAEERIAFALLMIGA